MLRIDQVQDLLHWIRPGWDKDGRLAEAVRRVSRRALHESVVPHYWIFRSLRYFVPAHTRVVILGQDPYHTPGKACGLSFGLSPTWVKNTGYKPHSSIKNVLDEVTRSTGQVVQDLSLESWAKQGVLLLNTRLTCAPHKPMSHAGMGWEQVVSVILDRVVEASDARVMAWGAEARSVARQHFEPGRILAASHPCKYSATRGTRPFVGCGHFAEFPGIKWGMPSPPQLDVLPEFRDPVPDFDD